MRPALFYGARGYYLEWADAIKLASAILGGLLIPFIGLVAYLVKMDSRLRKMEESFTEMNRQFETHAADRKIHVDPDRDGKQMARIEAEIKELTAKLDNLLKVVYSVERRVSQG